MIDGILALPWYVWIGLIALVIVALIMLASFAWFVREIDKRRSPIGREILYVGFVRDQPEAKR